MITDVTAMADHLMQAHDLFRMKNDRAFLLAVSGIDASGKGFISQRLCDELERRQLRVALIHLDLWHHPKHVRFNPADAALHFYEKAFRWNDLFNRLILPLQQNRSLEVPASLIHADDDTRYLHHFSFERIDVIVLEGIFLLRRDLRHHYDFSVWIECSTETALHRAIRRNQEKLSPEEIIRDYNEIYFPAQLHHFSADLPQLNSTLVFCNESVITT